MTDRTPIPTSLPLSPQDIHPGELAVILAEAAERHAEAAAALAAAQDHFDAAERLREYALTEEQKRREREEEARIGKLRDLFPVVLDDVDRYRRGFYAACAEEVIDFASVAEWFAAWAKNRALAGRMQQTILLHDSQRSREDYETWMRRIAGWNELIRSVTSFHKGGVLNGYDDDLDALAAVNVRINQESAAAPRPLRREAHDQSTPFIEDLGLRDPAAAGTDMMIHGATFATALEFNTEFSRAIAEAASSWARRAVDYVSDVARREFADAASSKASS